MLQYIAVAQNNSNSNAVIFEYNNPNIETLRQLSTTMPGELPIQINVEKIAETIRSASIVVVGEDPNKKMILARTLYQIVYPQRTIMLDSGMDYKTHRTFGKTKEPYFADRCKNVQRALDKADLIILTHYNADHVDGVVTSDKFEELAPKIWISELTADLMINSTHKKQLKYLKTK